MLHTNNTTGAFCLFVVSIHPSPAVEENHISVFLYIVVQQWRRRGGPHKCVSIHPSPAVEEKRTT